MEIKQIPTEQLRPAEYNPRMLTDEQKANLTESIKRFGLVDPILVNSHPSRENIVIGGHQRLLVAKELGYTEVPVVFVSLEEDKERELNLRLNRNTGEWNLELLREFDIELLLDVGFDDTDLGEMWNDHLAVEDDHFDVEKAVREIKKPKAKFGDLYALGDHRLSCNDATDSEAVKELMNGEKTSFITLDPIYGIQLSYGDGVSTKGKYGGQERDKLTGEEYRNFLKTVLTNALNHASEDLSAYCCNDQSHIGLVQELFAELGLTNRRVCMWVKNNFNPTPQIAWQKSYEPCMYATRGNPYLNEDYKNLTEILNKEVDPGNRQIDDIIDIFDIWLAKRVSAIDYTHPTQKPLDVYEKPLKRCSKVHDICLELFGGSGSALLACEQMKRRAYVMEKDPVFVDVIINRFEEATGLKAKKLN